jgi:hypothetical protein
MTDKPTTKSKKPGKVFDATVKVWDHEWPFRFRVESWSDKQRVHLVDISAYRGNGECSCENFSCRLAPELKLGRAPGPATRCRHIRAARSHFTDKAIRFLGETNPSAREGGT